MFQASYIFHCMYSILDAFLAFSFSPLKRLTHNLNYGWRRLKKIENNDYLKYQ